jgi:hypothetical protein
MKRSSAADGTSKWFIELHCTSKLSLSELLLYSESGPIRSPSGSSSLPATATSSTGSPQATIPVDVACGIVIGINGLFDVDLLQDNTPAVCVQQCANIGLRIAALTGGYWCYCMNSSSYNGVPPVSLPVSECNVPCEGDPTQMCGGLEASTFYRTPIYK